MRDDRIAMLSFTGSDDVGWDLKAISGKKKVTLELGGNAAVIIDKGTDLAAAAKSVAIGANLYAGQTCISTQRVYVVKTELKKFRDLLVKEFNALKSGAGPEVELGTPHRQGDFERIATWVG